MAEGRGEGQAGPGPGRVEPSRAGPGLAGAGRAGPGAAGGGGAGLGRARPSRPQVFFPARQAEARRRAILARRRAKGARPPGDFLIVFCYQW